MSDKSIPAQVRKAVVARARGGGAASIVALKSVLLPKLFPTQAFSIEHIQPQSRGGKTTLDNLALACQGCNNHKYIKTEGRDPLGGKIVPLYNPRQQGWSSHFAWSEDCTLIIGLTATGRATAEALQLNREGVVNLRKILYAIGEHPPV